MTDYYSILGIPESASDAEIKAAFKQKALRYHPDKNAGDPSCEEMFKQINTAYQTLLNPYERAQYDLRIKFGEVAYDPPPPPAYQGPAARPKYTSDPFDHKLNNKATLWAFGISLSIAIVVMSGIGIFNLYNNYQRGIMLGKRRQVFEQARYHQASGQIAACLQLLESLGNFHSEEADMVEFQENVLDGLLQNGTRSYFQHNYQEAIKYFQIFDDFAKVKRLSFEMLLAEAHRKAGNHDEAIGRFNRMIVNGNNTIENNLKVAMIYREGKKDYKQALNYYKLAGKMAVQGYKSVYGDAYPLILSPSIIPPGHFDIFDGMAQTFFYLENYERALSALKWNIVMWPDYPENYILKGKVFEALNRLEEACEQFNIAHEKGSDESVKCS